MKKIKAILIGAGQRGMDCYAPYALKYPNELEFVAVAEPNDERRKAFCEEHDIDETNAYSNYKSLLLQEKMADAVLICTQDQMHYEPTIMAMDRGYDILLEKPMSSDLNECYELQERAKSYDKTFMICHVLRYTPFFMELKRLIESKTIGDIITIQHNENVGYWHQAHSYVRGNWCKKASSSPMILGKCSHDMDILYWLINSECKDISSYGELAHFNMDNKPEGAPERCLDGCPYSKECPYDAAKIYLSNNDSPQFKVIRSVVLKESEGDNIIEALKTGPYGRCVYRCDNDVVDHQSVILKFNNNVIVSFMMTAFNKESSRTIKIMGARGEIRGHMEKSEIEVLDFNTGNTTTIKVNASGEGHGGGDEGLMKDFVTYLRTGIKSNRLSFATESYQSHLMAFAAEESRMSGTNIDIIEFESRIDK